MFFKSKVKGNKAKSRSCLCGKETCQEIAKKFRKLGDVRGDFAKLPNPRKQNAKDNFWIKRFEVHHKLNNLKEDVYNNTKNTEKVTRQSTKKQQKKEAYVARWHYPEILIEKYESKSKIPRFITRKDADDLHLLGDNQNTSSIYTKQDCMFESKKPTKKTKKKAVKPDAEEFVALIPNVVDEKHINQVNRNLREMRKYLVIRR